MGERSRRRTGATRGQVLLGTVVALLVGARLALPGVVDAQVRRRLAADPTWQATVRDVDVSVLRGGFGLDGVRIARLGEERPLLVVERVDVALSWGGLLDGALVAEVHLVRPEMELHPPPRDRPEAGVGGDWVAVLERVVPLPVDRLVVEGGEVHFRDVDARPPVDVWLHEVWVEADNLRDTLDLAEGLPARADASARLMGAGQLVVHLAAEPGARLPTFELQAEVRGADLVQLSSFVAAYGDMEISRGQLDVIAEITARDGQYAGYVKPVFTDLEGRRAPGGPARWTALVPDGTVGRDTPTGRVPVQGLFDERAGRPWAVAASSLRDALVVALFRGLEGSLRMEEAGRSSPAVRAAPPPEEPQKKKPRRGIFGRRRSTD